MRICEALQAVAVVCTFSLAATAQSDTVRSGTEITVRTNSSIDAKSSNQGKIYSAVVDRDVVDNSGRVVIPRGADAELIVRQTSGRDVTLDLESINVNGRRYVVSTTDQSVAGTGSEKEGIGKNKRTGKYVGGGALLGTIVGAIAGGGKGAAIGAIAGGGAGAAGQVVTRGGTVKVPAETLLTFRLDRPLTVGGPDDGYTRDGQHYHRYDNNQQDNNRQNNR
jgi:hypothetical protein